MVASDASRSWGCRAWWGYDGSKCNEQKLQLSYVQTTVKELLPILISGAVRGEQWANYRMVFHCDNQAVVKSHACGHEQADY